MENDNTATLEAKNAETDYSVIRTTQGCAKCKWTGYVPGYGFSFYCECDYGQGLKRRELWWNLPQLDSTTNPQGD